MSDNYGAVLNRSTNIINLASDVSLLTGRELTVINNTSVLADDYLCAGKITTGTSPTAGRVIEIWAFAALNKTPDYPDVFDGTNSDETVTSDDIKFAHLKLIASMVTDGTSDQSYPFARSIAALFGHVPAYFGQFVTHSTGVNLNGTAANQVVDLTPITY